MKTTKRTERVQKEASIADLVDEFIDMRNDYFIDTTLKMKNFSGAKFLILFSNMGLFTTLISQKICNLHPNLSPNLHILTKISTHFTAVAHLLDEDAFNKYIYHFSNDTSHDSQFSCAIADDLMTNNDQCLIFRFKSDNCSQQYKSRFVFANWRALAKKYSKTILLYYGVSGHGKGLVD